MDIDNQTLADYRRGIESGTMKSVLNEIERLRAKVERLRLVFDSAARDRDQYSDAVDELEAENKRLRAEVEHWKRLYDDLVEEFQAQADGKSGSSPEWSV